MMTIEILSRILQFAITGFVQLLDDLRARRLRLLEMGSQILHKYSQALRCATQSRRGRAAFAR
jgi:hypothetical protein